ncbi:succinate dehydrogenase flavoprotein subunit [Moniliophthora roreri]|nr:succinate dehydrogenase flavoprotein subunit [Moniliophthora roreri]
MVMVAEKKPDASGFFSRLRSFSQLQRATTRNLGFHYVMAGLDKAGTLRHMGLGMENVQHTETGVVLGRQPLHVSSDPTPPISKRLRKL